MKTIQTTVYDFEELSDSAKETARAWYREDLPYYNEFLLDDVADVADIMGLDIRLTRRALMGGGHRYDPSIYYSGFYSQGDGACFDGSYKYKPGALKSIKAYTNDIEILRICKALQDVQSKHFYRLTANCKHSGHYMHSGCMRVEVEDDYSEVNDYDDDTVTQCMRDFANWIYKRLETECEYQNSDDVIDENIRCNEYQFTEQGAIS